MCLDALIAAYNDDKLDMHRRLLGRYPFDGFASAISVGIPSMVQKKNVVSMNIFGIWTVEQKGSSLFSVE